MNWQTGDLPDDKGVLILLVRAADGSERTCLGRKGDEPTILLPGEYIVGWNYRGHHQARG